MKVKVQILPHSQNLNTLETELRARIQKAFIVARPLIVTLVLDHLSQEADRVLSRSMAEEYKKALLDEDCISLSDTEIRLTLSSEIANRIENGFGPFDLKPGILQGRSYVDVPFRYGVNKGTRFNGLPASVKGRIQALMAQKQAIRGKGPLPHVRLRNGGLATNFKDKNARFDGLLYQKGQYTTFRRVSQKSDPRAWWHPGFNGVHLFDRVTSRLKPQIIHLLSDCLNSAGLQVKRGI